VYDAHTAIIIEGLHALNPLLCGRPFFRDALKLYISVKTEYYLDGERILNTREMRLIRRIIRDNSFRGCPPAGTMSMWENVVRGEDAHIRPFRENADYWIDSLHLYEPLLYKKHLRALLTPCLDDPVYGGEAERLLQMLEPFAELPPVRIPEDSLMREFLEEF
jgi:uridine kinase